MVFIAIFYTIIVAIFIIAASLKIDSAIDKLTENFKELTENFKELKKEVESYNKTRITKDDISSLKKDLDYIVPRVSEICYKIKNQSTIKITQDGLKPGRVYSRYSGEDNLTPSNIC